MGDKWTPGPWHIVQVELGPGIVGDNGVPVAQIHSPFPDVEQANAQLIAAAPALVEALRICHKDIDPASSFREWLEHMERTHDLDGLAVLAAVEGE